MSQTQLKTQRISNQHTIVIIGNATKKIFSAGKIYAKSPCPPFDKNHKGEKYVKKIHLYNDK